MKYYYIHNKQSYQKEHYQMVKVSELESSGNLFCGLIIFEQINNKMKFPFDIAYRIYTGNKNKLDIVKEYDGLNEVLVDFPVLMLL